MAGTRLHNNNTSTEVIVCAWHLRRIFWVERLWEQVKAKRLDVLRGKVKPRVNRSEADVNAPYNQEIVIFDPATNDEIARCHWFLEADQKTPSASRFPDPKQIIINGIDYHLTGKANQECAHCKAGIPTTHDVVMEP
ncbi:MAG TPA: hypothetical protein VHB50_13630 [Bryobacteraceae bacterium]|nr:hypothetical protein [Bryobacteraceae bacterium]